MVNISFYLNEQKTYKNGESPVYMLITFNGKRIRKAVKEVKVKPSIWNGNKGRIRKGVNHKDTELIDIFNSRLEDLEESVHRMNKAVLKNNIRLDMEYVLDRIYNPENIGIDERSFFQIFDEYMKSNLAVKAPRTITGQRTACNFIKAFENEKKTKITLESINLDFFESFRDYSFAERGIATNYFAKIIAVLKTFMNWSFDRGFHTNQEYKKFKASEKEREIIYLTIDELLRLYSFVFESNRLDHVRDTFCFACFTGLRFSDVIQLRQEHIQDNYIVKVIQKTGEVNNKIPLNKYALQILEKYKDTVHYPLPKISNQKFNQYLKECCERVKIDTPVIETRYSGNKRTEQTVPKWKLISSHTARKTFVTNSLILGMKEMVIRNITGHKKEENFKKYVKVAEDFKKTEMDNTWDKL